MKNEEEMNEIIEHRHNYKKHSDGKTAVVLAICALLIVGLAITMFFFKEEFVLGKNDSKNGNEKVELKYTETNDKVVEGIYITDVSGVVENAMPAIVAITSKTLVSSGYWGIFGNEEKYQEGAGSGIIIAQTKEDLMILTNYHVIDGAKELSVQFVNEKSYDAKIVGTAKNNDIAVISVPMNTLDKDTTEAIKIATIGDSNELKVGNGIIAIGNALGYGQSVTTGVVSAMNRKIQVDGLTYNMIQIDAAINGGNSGGALLNSKGEVVGINSAKYSTSGYSSTASIEGMGFAIPMSDIKDLITSLMNGEDVKGATLGIYGYMISESESEQRGIPSGFYVSEILKGSGAAKSELEIGNIITKIEDTKVTSMNDLSGVLNTKKAGDKVTLTVKYISSREYKEKQIKVTLS